MFKNLKLSTKMIIGFGLPLAVVLVITLITWIQSRHIIEEANAAQAHATEGAEFAGVAYQMKLNVVQIQQYLTDISATRARDGLDDGFEEAENQRKAFLAASDRFKKLFTRQNDAENLKKLDEIERALAGYYETGIEMAKAYVAGGAEAGNKHMAAFDKASLTLAAVFDPFIEQQTSNSNRAMTSIVNSIHVLSSRVIIATLSAVIMGIVLSVLIIRSVVNPLKRIIAELESGAEQVNAASSQIASTSQMLAEGASEQASSLEETSSAMEEMATMTKASASDAQNASSLAAQARQRADAGDQTISRLNSTMTNINESSTQISKIIKVIEEIAFQTNLLALNAAVEAARAGEHGKGFAVVADEVRNLAQRAAQASKETGGLIEDSVQRAHEGADVADEVGKVLHAIMGDVAKVTSLVDGIAKASQEQAQGVNQVNSAISQMNSVTQQTAAGAEESASASEELSAQAMAVKGIVNELIGMLKGGQAVATARGETSAAGQRPACKNKNIHELESMDVGF